MPRIALDHPLDYSANPRGRPVPLMAYQGKAVTGWKKAYTRRRFSQGRVLPTYVLIELRISARVRAQQVYGGKCRAASAKVVSISELVAANTHWGNSTCLMKLPKKPKKRRVAVSAHTSRFIYRVGETVRPGKPYDPTFCECAPGIHFFLDQEDALKYNL